MLNNPVMSSFSERESSSKHARNCVSLNKIENSSCYLELVSHPKPEHVDVLSSLVRIKLHLSLTAINHGGRMWIQFLTFGLRFCSLFLHH